jgi:hypothetical protein
MAAVSWARSARQNATRQRGEQTRCGRRPVRGRRQTAHRPGLAAYIRHQARDQAWGHTRPHPGPTRRLEGEHEGRESTGRPCAGIARGQQQSRAQLGGARPALPRDLFGSCRVV